MTTSLAQTGDGKDSQAADLGRGTRKPRTGQPNGSEGQRFFLSRTKDAGGLPELGKEFATEPEVIVESLKTTMSYFTISEWRGVADFSGKKPQLKRESIARVPRAG